MVAEQVHVLVVGVLRPAPREHLVGRDGDRLDLLGATCVDADLRLVDGRLVEALAHPLVHGRLVVAQHERVLLDGRHRRQRDDRLAGAARQHHDAVPPRGVALHEPAVHGLALVVARLERRAAERRVAELDRHGLAVGEAGEVLDGPAVEEQALLEQAAHPRGDLPLALAIALEELASDRGLRHQLLDEAGGERDPEVRARRGGVRLELDEAVPADRLVDVREHVGGDVELRQPAQLVEDLVAGHAGRRRVPQGQRRDPVRVQQVGGRLELGEAGEEVTRAVEVGVLRLEEHLAVALYDDGVRRVHSHGGTIGGSPPWTNLVTPAPTARQVTSGRSLGDDGRGERGRRQAVCTMSAGHRRMAGCGRRAAHSSGPDGEARSGRRCLGLARGPPLSSAGPRWTFEARADKRAARRLS